MEKDIIVDKTEKIIINNDHLVSKCDLAPFKKFIIDFYYKIYSYKEGAIIVEKEYGRQLIMPYIGIFFYDRDPPKVEVYPHELTWEQVEESQKRIVIFCQLFNKEGYAEYTHKIMPIEAFYSGFPKGMLCDVLFMDVPYYAFMASVNFLETELCNYIEVYAQSKVNIPINFAVGDKVVCEGFGEGEIMNVDFIDRVYRVKFVNNRKLGIGFKSSLKIMRPR